MIAELKTKDIIPYLKKCGYKDSLFENYSFYQGGSPLNVSMVGFYGSARNSATACIAVVELPSGADICQDDIMAYQELGSPIVLALTKGEMQFWYYKDKSAIREKVVTKSKIDSFFKKHSDDFSPERIYRAKTIGMTDKSYQLQFVDMGLMPAVERKEGEHLAGLTTRIIEKIEPAFATTKPIDSASARLLFQATLWLIGAKILKDKQVAGFCKLNISDIDDLIAKIEKHYNASGQLSFTNSKQKKALHKVAKDIVESINLSHITTESMGYIYENTLVDKTTREALGIHSTPSWLVNYIVWQLLDWVENIPQENRTILEPCCGHAPFLTVGMRLLGMTYEGPEDKYAKYLREHLIGIEKDLFACEIAKLGLTLADIPNNNGWKIFNKDIYADSTLEECAKKSMILLCNPPFENFAPDEKQNYTDLKTNNKAAEILARTLPDMPEGAVFGAILPQGFLHSKSLAGLRETILSQYEIRTICNLPANVFNIAKHLSTILIGRKTFSKSATTYIRVTSQSLTDFKEKYLSQQEKVKLPLDNYFSFRFPELNNLWEHCSREYNTLNQYATIGRGIEYKNFGKSISNKEKHDYSLGFGKFSSKVDLQICDIPETSWLNMSEEGIKNWRYGRLSDARVVANYIRSSSGKWRIKAFFDEKGLPITNSFISLQSKHEKLSHLVLWAIINSPLANAYVFDQCMERHNKESVIRNIPVPSVNNDFSFLENTIKVYLQYAKEFSLAYDKKCEVLKKYILQIDAEVLRLYNLPPKLEKQLLDFFAGHQRKGVGFVFDRYYPDNFDSYVHLYDYLSEDFQNSTVNNVNEWVDKTRSKDTIALWGNAAQAFKEDDK